MEKSGMAVVPWQTDDAIAQVDNGVGANSISLNSELETVRKNCETSSQLDPGRLGVREVQCTPRQLLCF